MVLYTIIMKTLKQKNFRRIDILKAYFKIGC